MAALVQARSNMITTDSRNAGLVPLLSGIAFGFVLMSLASLEAFGLLPNLSLTSVWSGATVSGHVTLSAQADAPGLSSLQFEVSGQPVGPAITAGACFTSWDTRSVADGTYTVAAVGRDSVGNAVWSLPALVIVANSDSGDRAAPSVTVTSPAASSAVSGGVTLTANATDAGGVRAVWFTVDGTLVGGEDVSSPYQVSWDSTSAGAGAHIIHALARDAAGNIGESKSIWVTVTGAADLRAPESRTSSDSSAPSVTFVTPNNGIDVAGGVNLTVSAADNIGVVGVRFQVDGVNIGSEDTTAPFQIWWDSRGSLNGMRSVTAIARDAAGNTTTALVRLRVRNLGLGIPGDLNQDGFADLVFQHDVTGELYAWFMRWGTLSGERRLTPEAVAASWRLASVDDFDGDRKSDLVWQHTTTGQLYVWLMDGTTLVGERYLYESHTTWRLSSTGDLNGDGKTDLIWQEPTTGELAVSFLDGFQVLDEPYLSIDRVGPDWRIAGAADMNGDGRADILWQNRTTGTLAYWLMSSSSVVYTNAISPASALTEWVISAFADFDRDGSPDIVWKNSRTNQLYIWFMNGPTLRFGQFLSPSNVGAGWGIVGGR